MEINDLEEDTFFSTIRLERQNAENIEEIALDARPSDAVAIALIASVPILVSPAVILESSYPVDEERDEAEATAFKDFLEKTSASDFTRHAAVRSDDFDGQIVPKVETEDRKSDAT